LCWRFPSSTEAILEGMVAAFEFFGAVPKEVW
jgi:transposase